jgi:hypothetical protein
MAVKYWRAAVKRAGLSLANKHPVLERLVLQVNAVVHCRGVTPFNEQSIARVGRAGVHFFSEWGLWPSLRIV